MKRGPIDQFLRTFRLVMSLEGIRAQESDARAEKEPFSLRASITGKRYRDLSPDLAWSLHQETLRNVQLPLFDDVQPRGVTLPRLAFTWYPLFRWQIDDVWRACGTTQAELEERRQLYREGTLSQDAALREQALAGWPAHPAYVLGARRLSCSLCVLGDEATLRAGAIHQPDYYRALCWKEIQSGYSFQPHRWLCDVAQELLTEEMRHLLEQHPRRQLWKDAQARRQTAGHRARKVLPVLTEAM
jgi:3'-phosphoadenosine 5'-phosphosulfate sulfotransferase (PAPS reductase)/FAD synthetase